MPPPVVSEAEVNAAMAAIGKGQGAEVEAAMGGINAKVAAMGGATAVMADSGLVALYATYHAWQVRNGAVPPDSPPSSSYPPAAPQVGGITTLG